MTSTSVSIAPLHHHQKLPRLPDSHRISKRPLLRSNIPLETPHASIKTLYISSRTPFAAAAKRITKYLAQKETQRGRERRDVAERRKRGRNSGRAEPQESQGERKDVVLVKGSGRAIARVMALGLHFQKKDGYRVVVKTGSAGTVDDVVRVEADGSDNDKMEKDEDRAQKTLDVPDAQIRFTSVLEVEVAFDP